MSNEMVIHPDHYQHGTKECWDSWIDTFGVNGAIIICLGNTDKYLNRAGFKENNSFEQDIEKAKNYLNKAKLIRDQHYWQTTPDTNSKIKLYEHKLKKY